VAVEHPVFRGSARRARQEVPRNAADR
jgi:hypothetical protein